MKIAEPPTSTPQRAEPRWDLQVRLSRMAGMDDSDLTASHKHSTNHRAELEQSTVCGCFFCTRTFSLSEIDEPEWIDDDTTLLCPYCGVDSVIGSAAGYPLTDDFLSAMRKRWFW
jgi:hypothetical protein